MSRGPWIDPTYRPEPEILRGRVDADTVIIGAGLAGATLAWRLADVGADVVVLDASRAGQGASGRSAGFVLADGSESHAAMARTHGGHVAMVLRELGVASREMLKAFASAYDVGYTPCGSLRLAVEESELADLESTGLGLTDDLVFGHRAELPAPWNMDERFVGGLIDPGDAALDPVRLVSCLLEDVRATVALYEDSGVVQLQTGGPTLVVYTEHGHVVARRVVLCSNAWTGRLMPSAGPIQPVRAQMLEATVDPDVDWPMIVYARRGADYWRRIGPGRVLVGGKRDVGGRAENVDVDEPTAPVQSALDHLLRTLVPRETEITVSRRWAGLMGFTPDGLPVAGEVPGHPGVWTLAGFNGHGIGWAPGLAQQLASALGGDLDALPTCLAPSRFAYPA